MDEFDSGKVTMRRVVKRLAEKHGAPAGSNQRWSQDFVSDTLTCSGRFRLRNVIDDYGREWLACIVVSSLSIRRVVRELSASRATVHDGPR